MNEFDPNALSLSTDVVEEGMSVEDVAQMDAYAALEGEAIAAAAAEPTAAEAVAEEIAAPVPVPVKPIPVIPIKRRVSGRYRSCRLYWELELRVDVDGYRPMKRVSGDYFHASGATVSYFGSFVVNAPTVTVTDAQVTIVGLATTTWPTSYNKIRVVIPRHTIFQPPAAAHVQWMTPDNKKGASYTCLFESPFFRTVDLEQDYEKGVTPFASYNTGSLPSGGPARTLTVEKAYAEAGVQMLSAGVSNEVPTAPGGTWSNAELHAAMENHFSLWKDVPQWKVWLFHAMRHDYGPGLLGIMFDQKGKQRQGCAAFYQTIAGTVPANLRNQLYVGVHELGHCFNLFHSFHKKFMKPPKPNRLKALSWMNYPQNYPDGASAFWAAFPFQFDNLEVIHLRHAFRNNIIIGGNPFGTGAALEDPEAFADSVEDNSGLRLELEAPKSSFAYGEPVVTEIKLYVTDGRGKRVHKELHPNFGFVQVAIQQPSGEVVVYAPPIEHCIEVETTLLDESQPSIFESAYIGYDKERGQVFGQAGVYKLRGVYYALDGSVVLSNVIRLRIRPPFSPTDEEVAELFLGDEQGMLLYMLGSDSEFLHSGNEAFDLVLDKYAKHQLAVYARLAKGFNAAREFKTITADYQVTVREPQTDEAIDLLTAVVDASEAEEGVDNITLNQTMQRLAKTQIEAEDKTAARATMDRMVETFREKQFQPHVQAQIEAQAAAITADL
jgi:hypothetical protein